MYVLLDLAFFFCLSHCQLIKSFLLESLCFTIWNGNFIPKTKKNDQIKIIIFWTTRQCVHSDLDDLKPTSSPFKAILLFLPAIVLRSVAPWSQATCGLGRLWPTISFVSDSMNPFSSPLLQFNATGLWFSMESSQCSGFSWHLSFPLSTLATASGRSLLSISILIEFLVSFLFDPDCESSTVDRWITIGCLHSGISRPIFLQTWNERHE